MVAKKIKWMGLLALLSSWTISESALVYLDEDRLYDPLTGFAYLRPELSVGLMPQDAPNGWRPIEDIQHEFSYGYDGPGLIPDILSNHLGGWGFGPYNPEVVKFGVFMFGPEFTTQDHRPLSICGMTSAFQGSYGCHALNVHYGLADNGEWSLSWGESSKYYEFETTVEEFWASTNPVYATVVPTPPTAILFATALAALGNLRRSRKILGIESGP